MLLRGRLEQGVDACAMSDGKFAVVRTGPLWFATDRARGAWSCQTVRKDQVGWDAQEERRDVGCGGELTRPIAGATWGPISDNRVPRPRHSILRKNDRGLARSHLC